MGDVIGTINIVEWGFFGVLTLLTIGGALGVVTDRNLFHGALWLLLSLFGVAGFFVMLAAPFLAAVQVLVYIGAIVILIKIAIMLTRRIMGIEEQPNRQWPLGLAAAGLSFIVLTGVMVLASSGSAPLLPRTPLAEPTLSSLAMLGAAYVDPNQYAIPFVLSSVFLTGAMIGAIVVAREDAA